MQKERHVPKPGGKRKHGRNLIVAEQCEHMKGERGMEKDEIEKGAEQRKDHVVLCQSLWV